MDGYGDILLSEISQKDKYCMLSHMWNLEREKKVMKVKKNY
jgi:hypothetical protein